MAGSVHRRSERDKLNGIGRVPGRVLRGTEARDAPTPGPRAISTYQTGAGHNYGKMSNPKLDQMIARQGTTRASVARITHALSSVRHTFAPIPARLFMTERGQGLCSTGSGGVTRPERRSAMLDFGTILDSMVHGLDFGVILDSVVHGLIFTAIWFALQLGLDTIAHRRLRILDWPAVRSIIPGHRAVRGARAIALGSLLLAAGIMPMAILATLTAAA